ncbi:MULTISPECIES: PAS domain-containing protein [Sphingomonas]|uniref:PAS domain-containing protein n=1 Tax=Sphingomonas TaxID=13687 RepID=UPI00126A5143|nr:MULTISPECIES: PAS domain-containing protein [Sphingomonas]
MNNASPVAADGGPAQREGPDGAERRSTPLAFALLLVTYELFAWAGHRWVIVAGAAAPIWPAAGIAVAGLVLGGRRLAPAVLLGALAGGLLASVAQPWWIQLALAVGKTAGAWAAAALIERFAHRRFTELARVHDVLLLIAAAILSSAVSTAIGAGALLVTGRLAEVDLWRVATAWFFGDAVGILIITALILTNIPNPRAEKLFSGWRLANLTGALLAVAGLCALVFFSGPAARAWAIYPALGWVALAFRSRGAALGLLIVLVMASLGTMLGKGPFAFSQLDPGLLLLQQYLVVTAATTLLLAAAVDERNSESRLYRTVANELATRRELQRTTRLLTMIGDAAPIFIYAKDRDGRFIYANRELLEMYRRPLGEVIGRTDRDLIDSAESDTFIANDRRIMASGRSCELEEELTIDGEVRVFFSIKAPLRGDDGAITGIVGISTDVTDRRHQQQEVERLARRAEIAQRGARSSLYEYDVQTDRVSRDPVLAELCGILPHELGPAQAEWERHIHPHDLASFRSTLASALDRYERFALDYRVIGQGGRITWVQDSGTIVRDENGQAQQVIGLVTDITSQRNADEREQLLAREVDHRAKNLLAVVQSVVQLTRADDSEQLKAGITGRIQSLARAHSLLAESRWEGVELTALAREEVAPYAEESDGRITLQGPRLTLRPAAAQSIALVLHELATNAAKYGALSADSGRIDLSWCIEPDGGLLLVWQERGGPPGPEQPPSRSGFGSRLIKASVERQLRGTLAYDWAANGLTVTMTIAPEYVSLGERGDDLAAN